jgi:peptidoglycan/LPS O-acetylase OafA/YrhL
MNKLIYVPALDGLRTFAVGLVILHHISFRVAPGGHIGVDIFFVLSGFLLTGILLRERQSTGTVSIAAFYARRALRLMPALSLLVACELAFALIFGSPDADMFLSSAAAIAYLMDFVRAFSGYSTLSALGHTWSLSVEEHFYLVWPLLIAPLVKLPVRWRAPAILGCAAIIGVWRTYLVMNNASPDRIYYAFDTRADQLMIGCALGTAFAYGLSTRIVNLVQRLWPVALIGILGITIIGDRQSAVYASVGPTIVAGLSSVLILALLSKESLPARVASFAPFVSLGKISYGIYLWHWPFLIYARFYSDSKILALVAVIVSIYVAALSYRYVETPFLNMKHRFGRKSALEVSSPKMSKALEYS